MATKKTKKAAQPKPAARKASQATKVAAAETTSASVGKQWVLDQLFTELGAPPADEQTALVEAISVDLQMRLGTEYATTDILVAVPDFVGTALASWRSLSAGQKASSAFIGMSEDVLSVIVAQALKLRDLQRQFLASTEPGVTAKRDRFRATKSQAVVLRDSTLRALRGRVPANATQAKVRALRDTVVAGAGTAETGEPLAAGLTKVAKMVRDARSVLGADWSKRADTVGLTTALATQLEAAAAGVREAEAGAQTGKQGGRVDQRTLDLQDGIVCVLVQGVYRAFAGAEGSDASIVVPPLGRLRRLGNHRNDDAAEPTPPETGPQVGNGTSAAQTPA